MFAQSVIQRMTSPLQPTWPVTFPKPRNKLRFKSRFVDTVESFLKTRAQFQEAEKLMLNKFLLSKT